VPQQRGPKELTKKQEAFIAAYLKHGIAVQAYKDAGYNWKGSTPASLYVMAHKVLWNDKIQLRLDEIKLRAARKIENTVTLNKSYVLNGLVEIAETGLGRKKLKKSVVTSEGGTIEVEAVQPDRAVAARAFELMGKELAMFVDRKEIGGPGDFDRMNNDELDAFLAEQRQQIEHKRLDNQD
jgi:phage terminase small subunit